MTDLNHRLEGRPVIVTGGGSGIGRGACLRIASEGGRVAVVRDELAIFQFYLYSELTVTWSL